MGTKPKEIDVLIIKKDPGVSIRKNIGRIFRKHNIIEYKSPEDYLSIDDFYKVYGYACFYKSDTSTVNEIKVEEITITFATKSYPRKVIRHLVKEQHLEIRKQGRGIYYVYGERFPIQFIITPELPKEENFWLCHLTNDLKKAEEAEKLLKEYKNYKDDNLYQSLMEIIVKANKEVFREARGMCQALYELMEDEIKEREEVAEKNGEKRGEARGKLLGKQNAFLEMIRDGFITEKEAAKRLNMTEKEIAKLLKGSCNS